MHHEPRPEPLHSRFEGLVREYSRLIRGVVRRVAGPHADRVAEDAEQEILLALWKQVRQERVIAAPVSYVYRAAVRETVRLVRAVHAERANDADVLRAAPSTAPDPLAQLESAAAAARIRDALDQVPVDRRRAVEAHLAGLSAEEIMSITGWSYNRTRNLIGKGMADLRRALGDAGV